MNAEEHLQLCALRAHVRSNAVIVKMAEKHAGGFDGPYFDSVPEWLSERIKDKRIEPYISTCADYMEWTFIDFEGNKIIATPGDMIMLRRDERLGLTDDKLQLVGIVVRDHVLKIEKKIRESADPIGEMLANGIDVSVANNSGIARATLQV